MQTIEEHYELHKNYKRILLIKPGKAFDMSYEHNKHFPMVPYRTFCKTLSRLYNDLVIINYQEKPIIIYKYVTDTSTKNNGDDYKQIHVDITFFDKRVKQLIICLELIQNHNSIKDCNIITLDEILIDYLQYYNDINFYEIVKNIHYSYSTIVTLEEILNNLHVLNTAMEIRMKCHKNA